MMENSTSSRPWASLCAHCNTLAKWHTHEHHDILRPTINGQKVGNGSIPGNPHPFLDKVGIILYSLVYEITQSIKSNHSILEAREPLAFWDGPYSVCGVCLSLNKPTSYLKKKKKKKKILDLCCPYSPINVLPLSFPHCFLLTLCIISITVS